MNALQHQISRGTVCNGSGQAYIFTGMPISGWKRVAPAVGLFFLAPFISEYLLGDFPLTKIGYLFILAPFYGGGALLIREVVRRSSKGWPTILMMAFAYAVFEEAFTTQSLFNPNYLKLNMHLLHPAYIPALGIGGWWTVFVLTLHTVWSISTSIALAEACVPARADTPWLGWPGLTLDTILFVLAAIASTRFQLKHDSFRASGAQLVVSGIVVVVAAVAAFLLPARPAGNGPNPAPSPWIAGAIGLGAGSLFLILFPVWPWGVVAVDLVLDIVVIVLVTSMSHRTGWNGRHRLGLAGGAALAYGWHAFLGKPVDGTTGPIVRVSNAICLLIVVALIAFAARRQVRHAV
jgi:hypothetical protein